MLWMVPPLLVSPDHVHVQQLQTLPPGPSMAPQTVPLGTSVAPQVVPYAITGHATIKIKVSRLDDMVHHTGGNFLVYVRGNRPLRDI